MSRTLLLRCKCQNDFQDKKYGKGIRVHNECGGSKKSRPDWRCTVCSDKKTKE